MRTVPVKLEPKAGLNRVPRRCSRDNAWQEPSGARVEFSGPQRADDTQVTQELFGHSLAGSHWMASGAVQISVPWTQQYD